MDDECGINEAATITEKDTPKNYDDKIVGVLADFDDARRQGSILVTGLYLILENVVLSCIEPEKKVRIC